MNKENKEQEKNMKKIWLGNMSQFEKIFWATILLFRFLLKKCGQLST